MKKYSEVQSSFRKKKKVTHHYPDILLVKQSHSNAFIEVINVCVIETHPLLIGFFL